MTTSLNQPKLNQWSATDYKKAGFDSDGQRDSQLLSELGKPQLLPSPHLAQWLASTGGSLIFSTYQSGRLFCLGTNPDSSLYALERVVGTAMGLAIDRDKLWVGNREQIWRFSNTGADKIDGESYDAIYMPRKGYLVGNSNTHDVLADVSFQGQHYDFLYANTQFSCIATLDEHYTFRPVWVPDFISVLAPEDRCHLNGICAQNGELAYATICGRFDSKLGWKGVKSHGGFMVDVRSGETVCEGLSMPHSPRWHDGKLWLINSGEAQLGYVDFTSHRFVPVALCQGFARGIAFVGDHAVVALSRLRPDKNGLVGATADLQYYFFRDTFSPYAVAAVGGMTTDIAGPAFASISQASFIFEAGVGTTYSLYKNVMLRGDVRYRINTLPASLGQNGVLNDAVVNLGFVVPLGF